MNTESMGLAILLFLMLVASLAITYTSFMLVKLNRKTREQAKIKDAVIRLLNQSEQFEFDPLLLIDLDGVIQKIDGNVPPPDYFARCGICNTKTRHLENAFWNAYVPDLRNYKAQDIILTAGGELNATRSWVYICIHFKNLPDSFLKMIDSHFETPEMQNDLLWLIGNNVMRALR